MRPDMLVPCRVDECAAGHIEVRLWYLGVGLHTGLLVAADTLEVGTEAAEIDHNRHTVVDPEVAADHRTVAGCRRNKIERLLLGYRHTVAVGVAVHSLGSSFDYNLGLAEDTRHIGCLLVIGNRRSLQTEDPEVDTWSFWLVLLCEVFDTRDVQQRYVDEYSR